MFLDPPEFSPLPTASTREPSAWKGSYETYHVNVPIPAVRLHAKHAPRFGYWFAVDRYSERVDRYKRVMALVNPAEVADSFILVPGGIYNVGIVREQPMGGKVLPGGGFQFEYITGPWPQHNEHVTGLKGRSQVPL